jgi:hypothetical protein
VQWIVLVEAYFFLEIYFTLNLVIQLTQHQNWVTVLQNRHFLTSSPQSVAETLFSDLSTSVKSLLETLKVENKKINSMNENLMSL